MPWSKCGLSASCRDSCLILNLLATSSPNNSINSLVSLAFTAGSFSSFISADNSAWSSLSSWSWWVDLAGIWEVFWTFAGLLRSSVDDRLAVIRSIGNAVLLTLAGLNSGLLGSTLGSN